jgi:hypothetical protein
VNNCSCGCPTYGAHLRGKGIRIAYANSANGQDATRQKKWDGELSRFRDMEASGLPPLGTTHAEMDRTERAADVATKLIDQL